MALTMWGQVVIQSSTPQEDPVQVGTLWIDTSSSPTLKVCTAVGPYTWSTVPLSTQELTVSKLRLTTDGSNVDVAMGWKWSGGPAYIDGFYRLSAGVVVYTSNGSPAVILANGVSLGSATEFRWAPNGDLPGSHTANIMDVGLGRLAPGIMKVSGADASAGGTIKIGDPGTRPAASSTYRGLLWNEEGAAGVADVFSICLKDAADGYNWKPIVTG